MSRRRTKNEIMTSLILGGKSLKELNFPDDWEYDRLMHRWYNDEYTITSESPAGSDNKEEEYLYITDEMLVNSKQDNND